MGVKLGVWLDGHEKTEYMEEENIKDIRTSRGARNMDNKN
jgi:hypothetical protein